MRQRCLFNSARTCRRSLAGNASLEYVLVVALLSVALMVGDNSPLDQLLSAIGQSYQRFTYAISRP